MATPQDKNTSHTKGQHTIIHKSYHHTITTQSQLLPTPTMLQNMRQLVYQWVPSVVLVGIILLLWSVIMRVFTIPHWLLPTPTQVIITLFDDSDIIMRHTAMTLQETVIGFGLSLLISGMFALAIDASSLLHRALYPLLVAAQTVPIVAIAPLLVTGLGFGMAPKIIVVILVTSFPIIINLADGLRTAEQDSVRLLYAMNATYWQTLRFVRLPAALPSLFSGIKIGVTYSVIGAVLAEWIGASTGLGVYIARSLRAFRTDQVFVAILVTSSITVMLFLIVVVLERWLTPWHKKGEHNK